MKILKSKKALSPVVASIILIAVTVAVSIAVAAWMGALTFTFMGYEKLEITAVDWTWDASSTARHVNITVSNTGTRDVTVHNIEINHVGVLNTAVDPHPPMPFKTTDSAISLVITYPYTNGTAYDISVVTSSGYEFTDHFTGGEDVS
jgi:flagellin-like protein